MVGGGPCQDVAAHLLGARISTMRPMVACQSNTESQSAPSAVVDSSPPISPKPRANMMVNNTKMTQCNDFVTVPY